SGDGGSSAGGSAGDGGAPASGGGTSAGGAPPEGGDSPEDDGCSIGVGPSGGSLAALLACVALAVRTRRSRKGAQ
ncbi:MAG: carbohydrate-binding protein, partial [Polyangiaceae bacterium]|nr:carbohydrate-binding protein [Polyangiaceae bacterium]